MKTESVLNKTGKSLSGWYELIDEFGGRDMSHKLIARTLRDSYNVDPWWSQTICVEYEKSIGRRIEGQCEDGSFQLGLRRTFPVDTQTLWETIIRESELWSDDFKARTGEKYTTFIEGSHFRMQWTLKEWNSHSILQIRVMESSSPGKSVCAVHQEKLPAIEDRSNLKEHWKKVLDQINYLVITH